VTAEARPLRVLVAEDHAPTREDVQRALADDPRFRVCAAVADAAGAVDAALRERPDICLLDIRMPGGGLAAAWEICARLPQVTLVMLTVSQDDDDLFAALRAGAAGYLLKSMDFRRLPDALWGARFGQAALPRSLVPRLIEHFRGREPRWRPVAGNESVKDRLTSREWEILELLADGRSTAEIAKNLVLSPSAVRAHITSIVRKLRVADRTAAAALFRRRQTS
jgi:two-component system NarL family response regulator